MPSAGSDSAGPGPAEYDSASAAASELPDEVAAELNRIARRWAQLDLDRAVGSAHAVQALASRYAALLHPATPLPDLGPASAVDQLLVVTYDALAADVLEPALAAGDLATLRRSLP